jgi:hypothetical protein
MFKTHPSPTEGETQKIILKSFNLRFIYLVHFQQFRVEFCQQV